MKQIIFTLGLLLASMTAFSKDKQINSNQKKLQEHMCKSLNDLQDTVLSTYDNSNVSTDIADLIKKRTTDYSGYDAQIKNLLTPSRIKDVLPNVCLFIGKQGKAFDQFKLLQFAYQSPNMFNEDYGTSLTEEDSRQIERKLIAIIQSYNHDLKGNVLCKTNSFQAESAFTNMLVYELQLMVNAEFSSPNSLSKGLYDVRKLLSSKGLDCSKFE